ncbi:MAG TPA: hypothetical protein VFQ36_06890 [Ktedonobacteraceae bacterium]|nr:hypothetical protein [Ktedonobacteraceae bacterium]
MARGSSYGDQPPLHEISATTQVTIKRATRVLPDLHEDEQEVDTYVELDDRDDRLLARRTPTTVTLPAHHKPLSRHRPWLMALVLSMVCIVVLLGVAISAGMFQRPGAGEVVPYNGGQTFSIQVGGSYNAFNQWENSNGPIAAKTPIPIPSSTGPYSVLGKPTITADFINRVLASYGSPAAGLGQQMYDLGLKYGIDPVYALAFFMHESLFGTTGEARVTMSLGNLRCIPTRPCIDQNRGGYAQMYNWTDGFEQWYKLIRNLYVAQWGRVTVDQIIPKYAPNSDGNNEAQYIATLKREVDVWHAGVLRP